MSKVDFSDRVWCTLLWEFIQFADQKFSPATEPADKQAAVFAFMDFIRENSELLNPEAVVAWAKARQSNYPEQEIEAMFKSIPKH